MTLEIIAALLVGLAALALVLEPLIRGGGAEMPEPDEPPEFEETAKGQALTALRDIEFDRATGKLSEQDYQALLAKYTSRAVAVLREEEGAGSASAGTAPGASGTAPDAGADVERVIAARVEALRSAASQGAPACPTCGPRPERDAVFCSSCGRTLGAAHCPRCGSALAAGSRFCQGCGSAVAA